MSSYIYLHMYVLCFLIKKLLEYHSLTHHSSSILVEFKLPLNCNGNQIKSPFVVIFVGAAESSD